MSDEIDYGRLTADDRRHGTHNGYRNYRCRCDACKAAVAAYNKEHKFYKAWRAQNRLRGLNARGRPYKRVAP